MKSIKPGRDPSFMGGVMSILIGLFGVVWTVVAASSGGGSRIEKVQKIIIRNSRR